MDPWPLSLHCLALVRRKTDLQKADGGEPIVTNHLSFDSTYSTIAWTLTLRVRL